MGKRSYTRRQVLSAAALTLPFALGACSQNAIFGNPGVAFELSDDDYEWIEWIAAQMSLKAKCAQLVFCTLKGLVGEQAAKVGGEKIERALEATPVGGVLFDARNVSAYDQARALISDTGVLSSSMSGSATAFLALNRASLLAVLRVSRGFSDELGDLRFTEVPGLLRQIGANMFLGPNLDTAAHQASNNPGQDPTATLEEYLSRTVVGLQEQFDREGSVECPTGFPGTRATERSFEELDETTELALFEQAIASEVSMIQMGSMTMNTAGRGALPVTLSSTWINELKTVMGFDGVIVSAPLEEAARAAGVTLSDAVLSFLDAGGDMIFVDDDPAAAIQVLMEAIAAGTLELERVEESVRRILMTKVAWHIQEL